jgi:sugar/nucleoside kinase (ribokinase family)
MHRFVAIGDIVTDTFVKLKDARVHCDVSEEHCTITMPFGEKIPFESAEDVHAVGNSPNASVAAAKLGLSSALITNLGDDMLGRWSLATLKAAGVDTSLAKVHSGKLSNHHYVLWYDVDRTILVKHEEYDYFLPDFTPPEWLYLSSLGPSTEIYHRQIADFLKAHSEVKLAFQPGTFQINLGVQKLKDIYSRTNIFFANIAEAEKIIGVNTLGIKELLKRMRDLGPKLVVITDGPKGAHAYDGENYLFEPAYPDGLMPYERTGAGDAFASTCVAALALGNDLSTALKWGSINAASVVQKVGAQKGLLSREEIEKKLKPETL